MTDILSSLYIYKPEYMIYYNEIFIYIYIYIMYITIYTVLYITFVYPNGLRGKKYLRRIR